MKTSSCARLFVMLALSALAVPAFAAENTSKSCDNLPSVSQRVECIRGLSTKPSPSSPSSSGMAPSSSGSVRPDPVARTPQDKEPKVRSAAASGDGTCHTGPRGGTYTITASGRKNYSGC